MPIKQVTAYVVECELCHRTLKHPDSLLHPNPRQIDCFQTIDLARTAAIAACWTMGRELCACPICSPLTRNPPNTDHDRPAAPTSLEPGRPYPS